MDDFSKTNLVSGLSSYAMQAKIERSPAETIREGFNAAYNVFDRIEQLANTIAGVAAPAQGVAERVQPAPDGVAHELASRAEGVQSGAQRAHAALNRIEKVFS